MSSPPREPSLDPLGLPMLLLSTLLAPMDARSTSGCSQRWDQPAHSFATKRACSLKQIAASRRPMIKHSKLNW
jgi:hypothetical protein